MNSPRKTSEVIFSRLSNARLWLIVLSIMVVGLAVCGFLLFKAVKRLQAQISSEEKAWVKTLSCEELVIRSRGGDRQGSFGILSQDGSVRFAMRKAEGLPMVEIIAASELDSSLMIKDGNLLTRLQVGAASLVTPMTGATSNTGLSSIALFDKDGMVMRQIP